MKVFILDDQPERSEALKALLRQIDRRASFAQAANWQQVERALKFELPDLFILDWQLSWIKPAMVTELLRIYPSLQMAIFTQDLTSMNVIGLLHAGVLGIFPRNLDPRHLLRAFELVLWGGQYIHPSALHVSLIANPLRSSVNTLTKTLPRQSSGRGVSRLSPRQHEIMRFLHMGSTNKMVARALDISEGTVKIHLGTIYRLLGATNRASAVALYNNWQFERQKTEEYMHAAPNITAHNPTTWNILATPKNASSARTYRASLSDNTAQNASQQYIAAQTSPSYSSDISTPPLTIVVDETTQATKD